MMNQLCLLKCIHIENFQNVENWNLITKYKKNTMLVEQLYHLKVWLSSFFPTGDDTTTMGFHSYSSDGKQQDSSVVHNHMTKLIDYFWKWIRFWLQMVHCFAQLMFMLTAQYRSGTAYYLLLALAISHCIVFERSIQAPGHGKGENTCLYYHFYIFVLILTEYLLSSLLFAYKDYWFN